MTTDSLPSWRDTTSRQAIMGFVAAVADETGPGYVPPAARVAVFDNDGTLWCEKPMYAQLDLLLHDDAEREFAYTAGAERALEAARAQSWMIVSIFFPIFWLIGAVLPAKPGSLFEARQGRAGQY